ncbi:unnamed protein product [Rotaria socialis]|uniref:Carboxylic ester hydrolase n=4 Tax=Rotaria socialis TaxID=392032 RepID=A0A820RK84_9BILA|nr:unnamed protein product [Rotaria socialis]CAF3440934.1 unnamed protein product [Rotaria socialis]CAF4439779.1 unnamed protein product [Rotaria socialis]CAF4534283.1 unnamed protein product [Rotaria socialis]
MIIIQVLPLILIGPLIFHVIIASYISPIAETQQGAYIGRQVIVNGTSVNYWYGIPYAQQPTGDLRWKPPRALGLANDTSEAYISNACPQKDSLGVLHTESCLTLNVYTPVNASNVPVYVWIHGGSFIAGAGILYNATPFVSIGIRNLIPVVVVTINYRLGLLGFLADEALYDERSGIDNRSTTGNYGILDQMIALDWIEKNIQGFGGDPKQITIGGESAGGISVTALLTSPLVVNGTFQRAIVESGTIWPNYAIALENAIDSRGKVLRAIVNCTTLGCLRNLTVDQILIAQDTVASKSISGIVASPVIDNYVLDDIMENSYMKGNFQKIPILVGSNANETSLFTCPLFNGTANTTQVEAFFKTIYNDSIINDLANTYGSIFSCNNPLTYLNIVYSDSWAHCGSRRVASHFASHGLPSFLYTYDHVLPVTPSCVGVFHVAELLMLFPSLLHYMYPNYNFTDSEQQLSTNMILYWINFIRTSNPNSSRNLTVWDSYRSSCDNDFVLDTNLRMRNYYYNFTCSNLWDRYAVTNKSSITLFDY